MSPTTLPFRGFSLYSGMEDRCSVGVSKYIGGVKTSGVVVVAF